MPTRARCAAFLAGLVALDLLLNFWWHSLSPTRDGVILSSSSSSSASHPPQQPCTQPISGSEDELASLGRRVAGPERALLLTVLRAEQAEEAANFLAHVEAASLLPQLLAVVLDDASAALAQRHGVAVYRVRIRGVDATARHGSAACTAGAEDFLDDGGQLLAARWRYLATLARAGLHVWVADVRVLWRRGSLSTWLPAEGCDLALVSDAPFGHELPRPPRFGNASSDLAPAPARRPSLSLALGVHRPVPSVWAWHLRVARRLADATGGGRAAEHERLVVAEELASCPEAEGADGPRSASGCPRWCVLPAPLFPNGLQYFQHRVPQTASPRVQPVAILTNWVSPPQLQYRLREEGLWRLPAAPGAPQERYLAFKELLINNGLSNTRNALRSALAIAELTNRTLILPQFWSRHLQGEPYRVGVDYYFDWARLTQAFPRVREAAYLKAAFPHAASWPPRCAVSFVQLQEGEALCEESDDTELMEKLGNVNATCPPLRLQAGQLRTMLASRFHLGASEDELRAWLAPHAHEPLLYFGRMFRRFWRFSSAARHEDFQRRFAWGVQPAPEIRAVAAQALQILRSSIGGGGGGGGGGGRFSCVHMRRRDFVADHTDEQSVEEYARRAKERLHRQSSRDAALPLYLASDVAEEASTREAFSRHFGRVFTLLDVLPAWDLDAFGSMRHSALQGSERAAALAREMRLGNVDQLLCSEAERFVGNKWSSFTHHVCFLRQERGWRAACDQADIYGREIDARMEYV